jgi:GNAT superfamily N-acetyltransferase
MVDPPHGDATGQVTLYSIERGLAEHAPALQAVERAAGARFRSIGMADVAAGDPTPQFMLEERAALGRLLIALSTERKLAGFLIWSPLDGRAYIEEVSVDPNHAGQRLGARLIAGLEDEARGRHAALSLTTFRDVPWNAPYYASLGFVELPYDQAGPGHEQSWRRQADAGLDMTRRLFMVRVVARP